MSDRNSRRKAWIKSTEAMENEAGGRLPTLMNDDDDAMEESKIE